MSADDSLPLVNVTVRDPQSIVPALEPGLDGSHYDDNRLKINFRHPGYDPPHDIFLRLGAFDQPSGGLHHWTALVACGIVAGNAWVGHLTRTRDGPKIKAGDEEVLNGKEYYFHLPFPADFERETDRQHYRYPIVPRFQEWPFPHENLPPGWANVVDVGYPARSTITVPSFQEWPFPQGDLLPGWADACPDHIFNGAATGLAYGTFNGAATGPAHGTFNGAAIGPAHGAFNGAATGPVHGASNGAATGSARGTATRASRRTRGTRNTVTRGAGPARGTATRAAATGPAFCTVTEGANGPAFCTVPGGANGPAFCTITGGANGPAFCTITGGANGPAFGTIPGGANGPAFDTVPGGANGPAFGTIPGGANGPAFGTIPGGANGPAFGTIPGGANGPAFGTIPGGAIGPAFGIIPGGANGPAYNTVAGVASPRRATTVSERDGPSSPCRVSDYTEGLAYTYLCPQTELDWFANNGMNVYTAREQRNAEIVMDDERNRLMLRLDLHDAFDSRKFAFVPKMGRLVAHFLRPTACIGRLFHNAAIHPARGGGASVEFLLSRFAWAIFPSVRAFLEVGEERRLIRARKLNGCRVYMSETTRGKNCRKLAGLKVGPGGVVIGPMKKRKAAQQRDEQPRDDDDDDNDDDDDDDDDEAESCNEGPGPRIPASASDISSSSARSVALWSTGIPAQPIGGGGHANPYQPL